MGSAVVRASAKPVPRVRGSNRADRLLTRAAEHGGAIRCGAPLRQRSSPSASARHPRVTDETQPLCRSRLRGHAVGVAGRGEPELAAVVGVAVAPLVLGSLRLEGG
jgi:hypothetical protein